MTTLLVSLDITCCNIFINYQMSDVIGAFIWNFILFAQICYVAAQFFSIGWKMVMLGDETWIKLFPGLFTRQDGVSSFYVSPLLNGVLCASLLVLS